MSQTTVLERRHSIRRGEERPTGLSKEKMAESPPDRSVADPTPGSAERRRSNERREYLAQHHITVGRVAGSGGWMGGVCSCGEHTLSRLEGLIESWARWHRGEVMAQKASFVHTS
jgi:hypothetical protein